MEITFHAGGIKLTVGLDKTVLGIPYPKLPPHDEQNPPSKEILAHIDAKQKDFHKELWFIRWMIEGTQRFKVKKTKSKFLNRYNVYTDKDELLSLSISH